jgi:hypothetical protein
LSREVESSVSALLGGPAARCSTGEARCHTGVCVTHVRRALWHSHGEHHRAKEEEANVNRHAIRHQSDGSGPWAAVHAAARQQEPRHVPVQPRHLAHRSSPLGGAGRRAAAGPRGKQVVATGVGPTLFARYRQSLLRIWCEIICLPSW